MRYFNTIKAYILEIQNIQRQTTNLTIDNEFMQEIYYICSDFEIMIYIINY